MYNFNTQHTKLFLTHSNFKPEPTFTFNLSNKTQLRSRFYFRNFGDSQVQAPQRVGSHLDQAQKLAIYAHLEQMSWRRQIQIWIFCAKSAWAENDEH